MGFQVHTRLSCGERGATELKEQTFFADIDWYQMGHQLIEPPFRPPRGEVNAQDAFDIGSFDCDETKDVR